MFNLNKFGLTFLSVCVLVSIQGAPIANISSAAPSSAPASITMPVSIKPVEPNTNSVGPLKSASNTAPSTNNVVSDATLNVNSNKPNSPAGGSLNLGIEKPKVDTTNQIVQAKAQLSKEDEVVSQNNQEKAQSVKKIDGFEKLQNKDTDSEKAQNDESSSKSPTLEPDMTMSPGESNDKPIGFDLDSLSSSASKKSTMPLAPLDPIPPSSMTKNNSPLSDSKDIERSAQSKDTYYRPSYDSYDSYSAKPDYGYDNERQYGDKKSYGKYDDSYKPSYNRKEDNYKPSYGSSDDGYKPSYNRKLDTYKEKHGKYEEDYKPSYDRKEESYTPNYDYGYMNKNKKSDYNSEDCDEPTHEHKSPSHKYSGY